VAVDQSFQSFMNWVDDAVDQRLSAQSTQPPGLLEGSNIDCYFVMRLLGRGGMAEVYLAHERPLKRRVALKWVLPSKIVASHERTLVMEEAQKAARIKHENVVTVHRTFEHDGQAVIVMEYVEGETLRARLERGRLPLSSVISFGRQLADAAAAAHAVGVVHRDLKPENILITGGDRLKVVDFGIATACRADAGQTSNGSGRLHGAGTPGYFSPEQRTGLGDARSDIYTVGIVLFEMATGRGPGSKERLDDLFQQHGTSINLRAIDSSLPKAFALVVERALSPDPDKRWPTMEALEGALADSATGLDCPPDRVRLALPVTPDEWMPKSRAWRCPTLRISTATVIDLMSQGVLVPRSSYDVDRGASQVRWRPTTPQPSELSIVLDISQQLVSIDAVRRWKTVSLIAIILLALAVAVALYLFLHDGDGLRHRFAMNGSQPVTVTHRLARTDARAMHSDTRG